MGGKIRHKKARRSLVKHTIFGLLIGILILHPLTMAIYWFEFNATSDLSISLSDIVMQRVFLSFSPLMVSMTAIFALFGSALGLSAGWYFNLLQSKNLQLEEQEKDILQSIESLLEAGETSLVEFKSSLRWDWKQNTLNKSLEHVVIKTLAGFLNAKGGILLLGVSDNGTIKGLEPDYATLARTNRDGFHQHLMNLIATRIGTDLCDLVHIRFHCIDGHDICVLTLRSSSRPVYVHSGSLAKYYLRTGNSTRELNTEEAIEHVQRRYA